MRKALASELRAARGRTSGRALVLALLLTDLRSPLRFLCETSFFVFCDFRCFLVGVFCFCLRSASFLFLSLALSFQAVKQFRKASAQASKFGRVLPALGAALLSAGRQG